MTLTIPPSADSICTRVPSALTWTTLPIKRTVRFWWEANIELLMKKVAGYFIVAEEEEEVKGAEAFIGAINVTGVTTFLGLM